MTQVSFKINELEELMKNKDSGIILIPKCSREVILSPTQLQDFKNSFKNILYSTVAKYDHELDGIILSYKRVKINDNFTVNFYETGQLNFTYTADIYLFKPQTGAILTGIINKKGPDHFGCLVHKVFNIAIPRPDDVKEDQWIGAKLKFGQKVQFKVVDIDLSEYMPYIKGKLIETPGLIFDNSQGEEMDENNLDESNLGEDKLKADDDSPSERKNNIEKSPNEVGVDKKQCNINSNKGSSNKSKSKLKYMDSMDTPLSVTSKKCIPQNLNKYFIESPKNDSINIGESLNLIKDTNILPSVDIKKESKKDVSNKKISDNFIVTDVAANILDESNLIRNNLNDSCVLNRSSERKKKNKKKLRSSLVEEKSENINKNKLNLSNEKNIHPTDINKSDFHDDESKKIDLSVERKKKNKSSSVVKKMPDNNVDQINVHENSINKNSNLNVRIIDKNKSNSKDDTDNKIDYYLKVNTKSIKSIETVCDDSKSDADLDCLEQLKQTCYDIFTSSMISKNKSNISNNVERFSKTKSPKAVKKQLSNLEQQHNFNKLKTDKVKTLNINDKSISLTNTENVLIDPKNQKKREKVKFNLTEDNITYNINSCCEDSLKLGSLTDSECIIKDKLKGKTKRKNKTNQLCDNDQNYDSVRIDSKNLLDNSKNKKKNKLSRGKSIILEDKNDKILKQNKVQMDSISIAKDKLKQKNSEKFNTNDDSCNLDSEYILSNSKHKKKKEKSDLINININNDNSYKLGSLTDREYIMKDKTKNYDLHNNDFNADNNLRIAPLIDSEYVMKDKSTKKNRNSDINNQNVTAEENSFILGSLTDSEYIMKNKTKHKKKKKDRNSDLNYQKFSAEVDKFRLGSLNDSEYVMKDKKKNKKKKKDRNSDLNNQEFTAEEDSFRLGSLTDSEYVMKGKTKHKKKKKDRNSDLNYTKFSAEVDKFRLGSLTDSEYVMKDKTKNKKVKNSDLSNQNSTAKESSLILGYLTDSEYNTDKTKHKKKNKVKNSDLNKKNFTTEEDSFILGSLTDSEYIMKDKKNKKVKKSDLSNQNFTAKESSLILGSLTDSEYNTGKTKHKKKDKNSHLNKTNVTTEEDSFRLGSLTDSEYIMKDKKNKKVKKSDLSNQNFTGKESSLILESLTDSKYNTGKTKHKKKDKNTDLNKTNVTTEVDRFRLGSLIDSEYIMKDKTKHKNKNKLADSQSNDGKQCNYFTDNDAGIMLGSLTDSECILNNSKHKKKKNKNLTKLADNDIVVSKTDSRVDNTKNINPTDPNRLNLDLLTNSDYLDGNKSKLKKKNNVDNNLSLNTTDCNLKPDIFPIAEHIMKDIKKHKKKRKRSSQDHETVLTHRNEHNHDLFTKANYQKEHKHKKKDKSKDINLSNSQPSDNDSTFLSEAANQSVVDSKRKNKPKSGHFDLDNMRQNLLEEAMKQLLGNVSSSTLLEPTNKVKKKEKQSKEKQENVTSEIVDKSSSRRLKRKYDEINEDVLTVKTSKNKKLKL